MGTLVQIPVRSDVEAYGFKCVLDGATYQLGFRFNYRLGLWIMDVADKTGAPLVSGIPVQTNVNLLGRFVDPRLPPGTFLAQDQTGAGADAGLNDLGVSVLLFYQGVLT